MNLIYNRSSIEDIKATHGACDWHFTNDQFHGRVRKILIPGQLPTQNLANFPISDELIDKFKEQQKPKDKADGTPDNVLDKIDGIRE